MAKQLPSPPANTTAEEQAEWREAIEALCRLAGKRGYIRDATTGDYTLSPDFLLISKILSERYFEIIYKRQLEPAAASRRKSNDKLAIHRHKQEPAMITPEDYRAVAEEPLAKTRWSKLGVSAPILRRWEKDPANQQYLKSRKLRNL